MPRGPGLEQLACLQPREVAYPISTGTLENKATVFFARWWKVNMHAVPIRADALIELRGITGFFHKIPQSIKHLLLAGDLHKHPLKKR